MYRYVLLFTVIMCDMQVSASNDGRKTPELNKVIDVATRSSTCSRNKTKNSGNEARQRPRFLALDNCELHQSLLSSEFEKGHQLEFVTASHPQENEVIIKRVSDISSLIHEKPSIFLEEV